MNPDQYLSELDRIWRLPVVMNTHARLRQYKFVNKDDAWNRVMLSWWRHGFEHLDGLELDDEYVFLMLRSAMKTTVFHMASWEVQRRGKFKGAKRAEECCAADLPQPEGGGDVLDMIAGAVADSVAYDGRPGLLDFLTDRQREAVEMIVIGQMLPDEAASLIEGSSRSRVRGNARAGVDSLRAILEGRPNRKHRPDDPLTQQACELALAGRPFRVLHGKIVELAA